MFTPGQKVFAIFFVIAFALVMVYTYRKDLKLHKLHYKNVYIIILTIIAVIGLFAAITFSMH